MKIFQKIFKKKDNSKLSKKKGLVRGVFKKAFKIVPDEIFHVIFSMVDFDCICKIASSCKRFSGIIIRKYFLEQYEKNVKNNQYYCVQHAHGYIARSLMAKSQEFLKHCFLKKNSTFPYLKANLRILNIKLSYFLIKNAYESVIFKKFHERNNFRRKSWNSFKRSEDYQSVTFMDLVNYPSRSIVTIIEYLRLRDVFECRIVCKQFKSLIDDVFICDTIFLGIRRFFRTKLRYNFQKNIDHSGVLSKIKEVEDLSQFVKKKITLPNRRRSYNDKQSFNGKFLLFGEEGTGKYSFFTKYSTKTFDEGKTGSGSVELLKNVSGGVFEFFKLQPFESINDHLIQILNEVCGVFLFFSILNKKSFETIKNFYPIFDSFGASKFRILVGTHKDKKSERKVFSRDILEFAEKNGLEYYEISNSSFKDVRNTIDGIQKKIYDLFLCKREDIKFVGNLNKILTKFIEKK